MALSKTYNWVSNAFQFRESPWLICYEHYKFTRGILADWWMTFQISRSFASLQLVGLGVFIWLPQRWWTWTFCETLIPVRTLPQLAKWNNVGNSQCGTSNDFRAFKHVFSQCVQHNSGSCHAFAQKIRGFTRATTCCVTRRVPWCAAWPCRSWIITVWWTSFRWQDLRNLVKKRWKLVGLKLFSRPKCWKLRMNKYEYWMICLYFTDIILL